VIIKYDNNVSDDINYKLSPEQVVEMQRRVYDYFKGGTRDLISQ
jgi:hypothetical protein